MFTTQLDPSNMNLVPVTDGVNSVGRVVKDAGEWFGDFLQSPIFQFLIIAGLIYYMYRRIK